MTRYITIYFVALAPELSSRSGAYVLIADPLRKDTLSAVWPASAALCKLFPVILAQDLEGGFAMLRWALIFFTVALLAAVLGFTGIAVAAAGVAKVLFFLFVVLFLITLLGHVARRQ